MIILTSHILVWNNILLVSTKKNTPRKNSTFFTAILQQGSQHKTIKISLEVKGGILFPMWMWVRIKTPKTKEQGLASDGIQREQTLGSFSLSLCNDTEIINSTITSLKIIIFVAFQNRTTEKNYLVLCCPTDILMQFLLKSEELLTKGKGHSETAAALYHSSGRDWTFVPRQHFKSLEYLSKISVLLLLLYWFLSLFFFSLYWLPTNSNPKKTNSQLKPPSSIAYNH